MTALSSTLKEHFLLEFFSGLRCVLFGVVPVVLWLAPCALAAESGLSDQPVGLRARADLPSKEEIDKRFGGDTLKPVVIPSSADSTEPTAAPLRAPVITLQGAVEQSSRTNQNINRDRLEVSRFKWDYRAAQVSRLPNVRVLGYFAQQTVGGNVTVPAQADGFIFCSALFPVTQQYRLGLEARAIKLASEIAGYKLEQQRDETKAKVKAIYYNLILDQSKIATLDVSIKYLKELKTTTTNRVKEGSALKVDMMKVTAKLDKQELELLKARDAYEIDCEKFNHLMGRDIKHAFVLEELPAPSEVELNVNAAEQKALRQRPEVLAADARRRQINLEKKIRLAEYIPNVSVGAVFVSLPGYNNSVLPRYLLAPGFFVHYNAFDWGRRAFQAKAQGQSEQAATFNLAGIKDEVLIDLHSQIHKLTEARLAVKTSRYAREVATEDLRVAMNRYKYTSDKLAEVLESFTTLAEANSSYEAAMLSFWSAKAEFDRAVGE